MGELGFLELGIDRRLGKEPKLERLQAESRYSLSRSELGLGFSSARRTRVRAISNRSESKARPRSRKLKGLSSWAAAFWAWAIRSQAAP